MTKLFNAYSLHILYDIAFLKKKYKTKNETYALIDIVLESQFLL